MIGSGIAGLGAAHALRRAHDVEVFERDGRAGGHANTVEVDRGDGSLLALDTGFLVHNRAQLPAADPVVRGSGRAHRRTRTCRSA